MQCKSCAMEINYFTTAQPNQAYKHIYDQHQYQVRLCMHAYIWLVLQWQQLLKTSQSQIMAESHRLSFYQHWWKNWGCERSSALTLIDSSSCSIRGLKRSVLVNQSCWFCGLSSWFPSDTRYSSRRNNILISSGCKIREIIWAQGNLFTTKSLHMCYKQTCVINTYMCY